MHIILYDPRTFSNQICLKKWIIGKSSGLTERPMLQADSCAWIITYIASRIAHARMCLRGAWTTSQMLNNTQRFNDVLQLSYQRTQELLSLGITQQRGTLSQNSTHFTRHLFCVLLVLSLRVNVSRHSVTIPERRLTLHYAQAKRWLLIKHITSCLLFRCSRLYSSEH